ncbi:MAG: carboxypeptidase regulatory-like domain-containing protein, partial [Anaerolineales bacterium]|nr:carboxypeptidase regulatory-like domain-containing protein [Anaerolineales bacterium]
MLASILFTSCGEEPIDNGVEGTIEDLVTLKAIENAEVTTVPPTQSVLSDKDGKYQILDLDVGSYDLLVSANGYVKQKKGNIPVTDSFVTVNFQLKPSPDLVIDPMELVFSNNKNTLGLTIGRLSNRILKWRIDPNVIPTWLIVDPLSGETAAISSSVSVTVNRSKLPDQLQDHSTELVVRSNGGNVNIIITVTKDNGSSHLKIVPHRTGDVFVGDKPFAAPRQLVIVPRLRRAYITNSMANLITVVETFTDKVIRQIPINLGAKGLTLARGITHNPERGEIYIANFWQGTLSVVDALEMKEVEQLSTALTWQPVG